VRYQLRHRPSRAPSGNLFRLVYERLFSQIAINFQRQKLGSQLDVLR